MVDQKIELPNGDHLLFPADMPDADIQTAIEQEYPQFKASARSTLPTFDQAPPTAAELGVQFGPRGLATPVTKAQDILVDRAYAEQQQPPSSIQPEAPLPAPGIARAEEASRRNEARRNQQATQDFQKQQALLQQFDAGAVHAPEDVLANAMDAASRVTPAKPIRPPQAPFGAMDIPKTVAAAIYQSLGMPLQGGGELVARGINAAGEAAGFKPDLRAINPLQDQIDSLLNSRTPPAKRAEAESQISGELLKPNTWSFGTNPSALGFILQGYNAVAQAAPSLALALSTAGLSLPQQFVVGSVFGGMQGFGGSLDQERQAIAGMTDAELAQQSDLYKALRARGVPNDLARKAVADKAALGGGIGNGTLSGLEQGFENVLVSALTKGRVRLPSFGAGAVGRTVTGLGGGALLGGVEESAEQAGQNIGSNVAIGGDRPMGQDTLQNALMGALGQGVAGGVVGAISPAESPTGAPPTVPLHEELAAVLRGPTETAKPETPPPAAPVKVTSPADVAVAATRVNLQPTEAQKAVGNYAKGHLVWNGLNISIENPAGSTRSGLNDDGTAWNVQMPNDYGYIKRTEGADGEQADVYLGPNVDSPTVFIVDQIDPTTGKFDEHKNMLGFDTVPEAIAAYQAGFSDGSGAARMGAITQVSLDDFKAWLKDGKTDKAVTYVNRQKARTKNVQPTEAAQTEVPQASISQTPAIANRNDVPLVYPPDESGGFGEPNGSNTTPPRGAMDTGAGARPTEDLSLDRRHTQQQPAEEHRQAERRTHSDERKKVSEMTHEELRYALLTDHLTEANNRRAYEEAPKLPIQASVDVDSLKWVNDNLGHAAGDQLLKTVAAALKAQTGETYHISGDEFIVQGRTVRAVNVALKAAQEALRSAKLEATDQAGNKTVMNGVGFSYGTGKTLAVAEEGLHAAKASRERAGHRAARGEIPPGVVTIQKEIQNAQTIRGNEGQVRQRRAQEQSRLQQGPEQSGGNLQQPTSRRASDQPARVQEAQKTQPPLALQGITNRPLASKGLVSYRYQGAYGPIMLGAENHTDALRNAQRSLSSGIADLSKLEIWNGTEYVPVQSIPPRITMADLAEGMGTHLARATDISAPSTFRKTSVPEMVQEAQARIAKIEREHPEPKAPTGLQSLHAPLEVLVRRVSPARSTLGRKIDLRPAITRTRDLMNGTRTPSAADVSWLNRHAKQYEQYEPQATQALRDISATIKALLIPVTPATVKQPEATYQVGKVAQTETPEFKRWFSDSKVVDAKGKPMVVYHATSADFNAFKRRVGDIGMHFGTAGQANDRISYTQRFPTKGKEVNVMPVYLSIKNPLRLTDPGAWNATNLINQLREKFPSSGVSDTENRWDEATKRWVKAAVVLKTTKDIREFIQAHGYDGVVYKNTGETAGGTERQEEIDRLEKLKDESFSYDDPVHQQWADALKAYEKFRNENAEDSYIAFERTQIKSAIGNKGTFNPKNPNILEQNAENYAEKSPVPIFYSQLANQIAATPERIFQTGRQMAAWLDSNSAKLGIKKAELEATGITDWLKLQGKVSKADVQNFVKQGGVQVKEVMLQDQGYKLDENGNRIDDGAGGFVENGKPTKFAFYQLPGGENYKELLLTLPQKEGTITAAETQRLAYLEHRKTSGAFDVMKSPLKDELQSLRDKANPPAQFKSSHYDQPNILAHIRFNERTDAEGKKVLFLEELQSDWGQKGKKEGFNNPDADKLWLDGINNGLIDDGLKPFKTIEEAKRVLGQGGYDEGVAPSGKIPAGPFVTDTKAWTALALKRMIRYAAENGFDKVAWTTGEQQAARYDLSKTLKKVVAMTSDGGKTFSIRGTDLSDNGHDFGVHPVGKLEEVVGKDLATKIAAQTTPNAAYAGNDLKVGGEGMKGYYDQIVPQVANDILKKLGGGKVGEVAMGDAVEQASIGQGPDYRWYHFNAEGYMDTDRSWKTEEKAKAALPESKVQQGFTITPEMRSEVVSKGLPLFQPSAEYNTVSVPGQDLSVRPDPTNQDVYYVTAKLESVGTRALPTQIKTVEDAVRAFSYQPQYAVEHYDAIVTDAAGKPLAVIGSFKGAATQTSVFPSTVIQELALVPGAKTLWTAHNHPSGLAVFSEADRAMNRVFVDLLQGSGIDYRGLFAMTRKNQQVQFAFVDTSGNAIEEQITNFKEGGLTQTVPIQERMISGEPTDFGISSPSDAKRYIPQISKGNAGIVLLSAQHHPVAFIALSSEEVFPLRENDRFLKLVNKIAKTNAGAAFIVNPNDTLPERHLINLSASLAPLDIRALDVLNYKYDPDGGVRDAQSLTEKGWFTPPPFFLSKASQTALDEAGFGSQRQHQTTPYEALAHIQKTHPTWMPAITQVIKLGEEGKRGGLILNSQTANVYRAAELIAQKRGVSVESLVPSTFQQFSSELANGYSFSQGKESAHIITVKKAQDAIALAEKHGGSLSQNSDGSWAVSYVDKITPEETRSIPMAVENLGPASKDGWTQGFYSPELGISFINTDHLATHEVPGVLLHEVLHQTADKETLALGKEVLKRIQTVQPGGKGDIYSRVKTRMEQAGVAGDANEAANYLVEEAMNMGSRAGHSHLDHGFWAWAQKVLPRTALLTLKHWVAAVRAALYKHGVIVTVEDLKVDDIAAIAVGNLSELAAGKRQAVSAISSAQFQQSVSSFTDKIKDSLETKAFEYLDEFGPLEDWQKTLGKVPADQDAQMAQQRYSGLVAARVEDFHDDMLNPFFEALEASGINYADVETYLYAKHAPSRNAEMEKINPGQPALSGMADEEAADILRQAEQSGHKPALEALAKQVYAITAKTRENLVQGGLLTSEERAAWEAKYKNYVPLHRDEVQSTQPPLGKGFSIKGPESKRALGSEREATNILANTFAQHEASIIRVEKNKVSRALFELLSAHPDAKVGQVDSPDIKKVLDKSTGTVAFRVDPFYKNQPHVLSLKIDGEEHTVSFNMKEVPAQRMAYAFKNLGGRELGKATLLVGKFTRFLATMSTSANPVFLARNFVRDLQTAAVNLHDTPIKNKAKVFYNVPAAMRGFYAMSKDDLKSPWAKHAREFRDAGGQVGWLAQYKDIEDRAQHYKDLVHSMRPGALAASTRAMRLWWSFVEDANAAVENAVRLSAYATAREEGISEAEAAMIAKNLTVNFNIRGAKSVELNMWYMFAKASINGTARMFRAAKNPRVRKIMGGMVVVGFLLDALARGLAGDDDGDGENDYDQLSEYTKANNWTFWVAGRPVTIPQSYGLNFFPNIGRKVSQLLFQKGYHAPTAAQDIFSIAMNAYSPLGTGGSLLQTVMPTIADPFIQLAENQNFASQPIYKKQMAFGPDKPEYQMGFKSASLMSQVITEWLNNNSRGNAARPGLINLNPSVMDFAVASIFGGAGKTYTQALSLPAKLAFDKEIEAREVPFVNIVLSAKPQQQTQRKYHDALEQVQTVAAEYKDPAVVSEDWKKEHAGEIALIGYSKRVEARLKKLNGWEKDLPALRNYPQQLNNLEAQIRAKFPQYTEALDKGIGKGERTDVIISIEEKILEEEKSEWMRDFNRKFYETVVK